MAGVVGIRREDKSRWERRVPLAPTQVRQLVEGGLSVVVQPSDIRIFPDQEYEQAGAVSREDLSGCDVVLGVKEMPVEVFRENGTYVFFSHTIKGQAYNMEMLKALMARRCQLLDYETVADDEGRRLIFFGRYAGLAGMIDSLWAFGRRLEHEGLPTAFARLQPAHRYASLEEAEAAIREVGSWISGGGLPEQLTPVVVGFTGYGNVSGGAQEILSYLPVQELSPADLLAGKAEGIRHQVVKVVLKEIDTCVPRDPQAVFDLQHYFANPGMYTGRYMDYLPHFTILMNCIFWSPESPRVLTRRDVRQMYGSGRSARLKVVGDVSCDIEGGVEITLKATGQDEPLFVYDPDGDRAVPGVQGTGPVVMAVDNLPCELPRESSLEFGTALLPFVAAIARADYSVPFEDLHLPPEIKRAAILHHGELTPEYHHMRSFL
jgi:alpha-aminoadipic semialdehyde synthase